MVMIISVSLVILGLIVLISRTYSLLPRIRQLLSIIISVFLITIIYIYNFNPDSRSFDNATKNSLQTEDSTNSAYFSDKEINFWAIELWKMEKLIVDFEKQEIFNRNYSVYYALLHSFKGNVLRNMMRFTDSIIALKKAERIINYKTKQYGCEYLIKSKECGEILLLRGHISLNLFRTFHDLNNKTEMAKYSQLAQTSFFEAFQNTDDVSLRKNIIESLSDLYRRLYISISWLSDQITLISYDARDFTEVSSISDGKDWKYGMSNAEEDRACLGGLLSHSTMLQSRPDIQAQFKDPSELPRELVENSQLLNTFFKEIRNQYYLEVYVREQINVGNFEIAAKYLYIRYITNKNLNRNFEINCTNENKWDVTFDEVRNSFRKTPSLLQSQWTTKIIHLFDQGNTFYNQNCK